MDDDEVDALRNACSRLVEDFNPEEHHCIFTTTDYQQVMEGKGEDLMIFISQTDSAIFFKSRDSYFLESGDKIRYFLEADAIDKDGHLVVDKDRSLNKIGHALHWLEPTFKRITFGDKVQNVVKDIGFVDPAVAQSMYIFKQPGIGGEGKPSKKIIIRQKSKSVENISKNVPN